MRKITEKISWLQSRANDTRILWEKYFFRNDIDKTSSPMFLLKPLVPVSKNKSFGEFPDHNMVSMLKSRCPIVFDNIWKIQSVFALREIIFLVSMKITSKNYPLKQPFLEPFVMVFNCNINFEFIISLMYHIWNDAAELISFVWSMNSRKSYIGNYSTEAKTLQT